MSQLKPAAQRVQDMLRAKGLDAEVRHMPASTRTAQEAADACGCQVGQIVKSLIFRGARSGQPYLLLVSGGNRVDETGRLTRSASRSAAPTHNSCGKQPGLPSAAYRRSAMPSRLRRSSTRHC